MENGLYGKKPARPFDPAGFFFNYLEPELGASRGRRGTTGAVMMGLDFFEDRRDIGVGLYHGNIHFLMEGTGLGNEIGTRFFAGFVSCLHLFPDAFLIGSKGGIRCDGCVVGLVEFLFFGVSQEVHSVMMAAGRRRRRLIGGICRLRECRAAEHRPQG
jgi:hypothetical protein